MIVATTIISIIAAQKRADAIGKYVLVAGHDCAKDNGIIIIHATTLAMRNIPEAVVLTLKAVIISPRAITTNAKYNILDFLD